MSTASRAILRYRENCAPAKNWALRTARSLGEPFDTALLSERSAYLLQLELPDGRVFHDLTAITHVKSLFEGAPFLLRLQTAFPTAFHGAELLFKKGLTFKSDPQIIRIIAPADDYRIASRLFVQTIALAYFAAFVSSLLQLPALSGSHGLNPLPTFPGTNWTGPALDWALRGTCGAGVLVSVLLFFRIAPILSALGLYALYYLVIDLGQNFYQYSFDYFLLELGALAVLFGPFVGRKENSSPPRLLIWYTWWLLFQPIFSSALPGVSALIQTRTLPPPGPDLFTQVLPAPGSWWYWQFPNLQRAFSALMVPLSLLAAVLIWCGPRGRRVTAIWIGFTTLWGSLLGNTGFCPLMSLSLGVLCLDDACLSRLFRPPRPASQKESLPSFFKLRLVTVAAAFFWFLSICLTLEGYQFMLPTSARALVHLARPLRLMTSHVGTAASVKSRPEIIVEGSANGIEWREYALRWKPGDPAQSLRFTFLYHPRLDWEIWFPFTGTSDWMSDLLFDPPLKSRELYEWTPQPWLVNFLEALKRNDPKILSLLDRNPFPDQPPAHVRLRLYDYQFTPAEERRRTGLWWTRKLLGTLNVERHRLEPVSESIPNAK